MNEKIKKSIIVGIVGLLMAFFVFAARVYVLPSDGGTGQDSSAWDNVWIRVMNGSWTSSTNVFIATGTAPTIDAITNIGVDITEDQLQYYGTAKRVLSATGTISVVDYAPSNNDDGIIIAQAPYDITITGMRCITSNGSTTRYVGDGTNYMPAIICNPFGTTTDVLSNNTFSAGESIQWNTDNTTGTPTFATLSMYYQIDAK